MNNRHDISRKHFIKGCSAAVGLFSVGMNGASRSTKEEPHIFYKSHNENQHLRNPAQIRGSWVRVGHIQSGDIQLKGCRLVVDKKEHSAVHQAASFLAEDIAQISGYRPSIEETINQQGIHIVLTTLGNTDLPDDINWTSLQGKWEAFRIATNNNTVWLVGSNFRGTAFAAYTLSERLGIDPLYLWTGYTPQRNTNLILQKTDFFADEPTIKYRGFFHDDEDVLPRPFDKYGFPLRIGDVPLEWYQRFFETSLRLRMNMTAPYVRVHRRYEVQKCASDWGLYYTSHHYDILLSNPFGIERFFLAEKRGVSTDWDWFKNKENMIRYWRGGVEENKAIQAIWPVGLRGTDDHAYEFPKDTSEKEQAKVFREAIDIQVNTVKEVSGTGEKPVFHFTLYTEMLEKYKNHPELFDVPDDVILVWPDNNDGIMRDLPNGTDNWKHGVYYHLAYYGGAPTKQGPHVISPMRIAQQFKNIVHAGATEFLLVNVSEMREHVMEARMIADIGWDASVVLQGPNPAVEYIKWWANEYFGIPKAEQILQSYQAYYDLFDRSEKTYYGAVLVEDMLDKLHKRFTGKEYEQPDKSKVIELKARAAKYQSAFETMKQVRTSLNRVQKQFFYEHVEFGLAIDYRPIQAVIILLQALQEPDEAKAWGLVAEAAEPLEQLEIEILRAERPPFDNWYQPTWIKTPISPFNVHRSYTQIREFITNDGKISPVKKSVPIGHNIEGAKLWTTYLEAAEKIKATY